VYSINYLVSARFSKFVASFCRGSGTNAFSAQRHRLQLLVIFMVDECVNEL